MSKSFTVGDYIVNSIGMIGRVVSYTSQKGQTNRECSIVYCANTPPIPHPRRQLIEATQEQIDFAKLHLGLR